MKYLNLGCGSHYSTEKEWTNLDFVSYNTDVIAHNLLKGIPFKNDAFDMVYHSHVLEHFSKSDGASFIKECYRVLKPGGILRVVIPDLEQIARNYIKFLELGVSNPEDQVIRANYEWMMLEMYDQTVRETKGGEMAKYLLQKDLLNKEFVFSRLGEEGKQIRNARIVKPQKSALSRFRAFFERKEKGDALDFRKTGEIHLWMYDRNSLNILLQSFGFKNITVMSAFESNVSGWTKFNLDGNNNVIRKPDSLFLEAIK